MWPRRVVIPGVMFGLLLGVSAFWQTRDPRTPPTRPPQDTAKQAANGQTSSLGDPTRPPQEKSRPPEPIETAMEPSRPPKEPKPSEPRKTGTLSVNAQPWAKVWIDRKFQGETPLELDLPAGRHRVVLVYEKQEITRSVMIKAGKMEHLTHTW